MRILSKFHDYYDGVQNQGGFDNTLIFNRESSEIAGKFPIDYSSSSYSRWNKYISEFKIYCFNNRNNNPYRHHYWEANTILIGVAGKLYQGLEIKVWNLGEFTTKIVWSLSSLQSFLSIFNIKLTNKDEYKYSLDTVEEFEKYFNFSKDLSSWMIENKYSIVCSTGKCETLIINPCLKEFDFQKVINPYTLFQELSLWIGGVLTNNPIIEPIPDKYKIEQYGFGPWSFRKHKLDNFK